MKKNLFYAAMAIALASCASDDFVGENNNSPNVPQNDSQITFGLGVNRTTRADIYGSAAATLLGNHFYVTGTKGTEAATSPSPTLVFDNYLVAFGANTAGTTESNTANWEYVGVTPDGSNYVKLSTPNNQTIKYWDYSTDQYDFLAFSTGANKAVSSTSPATGEIGVTKMNYGASLASNGTAYTFTLPDANALKEAYISDITTIEKANYGKEVRLKFKNLGSKVRIALYETLPGYAVKDVNFYALDGTTNFTDANKNTTAKLISATGIPTSGTIQVYFPHVGTDNRDATPKPADYNLAAATVAEGSTTEKSPAFGSLANFATSYEGELTSGSYIGRTLPTATFAGTKAAEYYQTVFPVSTSEPLTLRVDYTLVSIDNSGEEIKIYGAKAVVPSTYTKWLPNYAYTYIFKISDNTNGWTSPDASTDNTDPGLFPITFDAVVAEATDANGEPTTITTVATPSITTYQQGHSKATNEYSIGTAKDVYVQVMDNKTSTATLVSTLSATNSLLYAVSDVNATEAEVMDALEKRTTAIDAANVTGRNGITLTKNTNIDATVNKIVNGVDNNPISVTAGQAAKIAITASGFATGTYAFVYDYTDGDKTTTTIYQPITVTGTLANGTKYVTTTILDAIDTEVAANVTAADEAVNKNFIYFSKTKNGTGTTTYSFVSVDGKSTLPAGLVKCPVSSLSTSDGSVDASAAAFVFTTYITNNGKYAVKIIKIVA